MDKVELIIANKNVSSLYMDCDKLKTFRLGHNTKNPMNSGEWGGNDKKTKWRVRSMDFLTKELDPSKNFAIPTGKDNMCFVVDCDFYSKPSDEVPFDKTKSEFIQRFPNYLETDTLICETGSGGHHLFFQFDPRVKQTANEKHRIDIRSNGGLVVAPGSVVNGKEYKIINYQNISKIPTDMKEWLLENIYKKKKTKKPINPKVQVNNVETQEIEEHDLQDIDLSVYTIAMTDYQLKNIIRLLPEEYFNSYQGYLIFTTAMKSIGRKDLWKKYPKLNNPVNNDVNCKEHHEWMESCWNGITQHKYILAFNNLLLNTKYKNARTMLDYYKYKPTITDINQPNEKINSRKLGYGFFDTYSHKKCLFVRSDTGTGKTTSLKHWVKGQNKPFISIVSRITLGRAQEETFKEHDIECHFHQDITDKIKKEGWGCGNTWMDYEGENVIINIDSILKLSSWEDFSGYCIYLDEVNSMIEHLVNVDLPTISERRRDIFLMLEKMFNECDIIIGTDADINDITMLFMKQIGQEVHFIENEYQHNKGTKCSEIHSYEKFCKELNETDKWICCCDSKSMAEVIANVSGTIGTNKTDDILLITSETKGHYNLDEWNKVIYSPKIIYGLDSTMRRKVFCYYKEHTISPRAMLQQVNRCRDIIELRYLFTQKSCGNYKYHSYEDVKEEIEENDLFSCNVFKLSDQKNKYDDYLELLSRYKYNMDCYNTNKFAHFIKLLKDRGFKNTSAFYQTSIKGLKEDKEKYEEERERQFLECVEKYKPIVQQHRIDREIEIRQKYDEIIKDIEDEIDPWHSPSYMAAKCEFKVNEMKRKENPNKEDTFSDNTCDIQEYLNLPMDTLDKHIKLYHSPQDLGEHFGICKWFRKEPIEIWTELEESMDFNVKKTTCKKMKYILLDQLREMICEYPNRKTNLSIVRPLTEEQSNKMNIEYKTIYGTRKSEDIDYRSKYKCKQLLCEMMKHLFGKEILEKKKVKVPVSEQEEAGCKTRTEYSFNTETYDYHMEVLSYRKEIKFEEIYEDNVPYNAEINYVELMD